MGYRIKAGDEILIPIAAVNRLKALWGEDAGKFKSALYRSRIAHTILTGQYEWQT